MGRALLFIVAILTFGSLVAPASAMTFKKGETRSGVHVVVASGEIKRGDATRLARALEDATRDRYGTKQVYLNSPGGLVVEALKMAEMMEKEEVTVIVRKGDVCASACASILFVSGKYRTLESGGMLAIHSCYNTTTGRPETECNMMISAYAEHLGLDGTAMMALHEAAGSDLIVFDRDDAACFGLTRKPGTKQSRKTPPCVADMMRELGE
jgi:hypothetical protein